MVGNVSEASFPVKAKKEMQTVTVGSGDASQTLVVSESVAELNSTTVEEELSSPAAGGGKSQLIALLLCAFIGTLGIHRFYLGYKTEGIIQLLTLGACGVWTLIDLIRIITGDLKPKDGDYTETL